MNLGISGLDIGKAGGVKYTEYGSISVANNVNTANTDIGQDVVLANSLVIPLGTELWDARYDLDSFTLDFVDVNTISATRGNNIGAGSVKIAHFMVIEFEAGMVKSKQDVVANKDDRSNINGGTSTVTTTITSVDVNKSILMPRGLRTSDTTVGAATLGAWEIVSATSVINNMRYGSSDSHSIHIDECTVMEFN